MSLMATIHKVISDNGGLNNYRDLILLEQEKCKASKQSRVIKQRIYNRKAKNKIFLSNF